MASTFVVQQQVRLKGEIWMFYGDLMTFFSKVHRKIGTMSSALVGLPEEVRKLVLLIYGKSEFGQAAKCQFDSEAGLSDDFENWMGWLMGCVLSPAQAKYVLHTVLCAMHCVAKGVRLHGFEPDEVD